MDSAKLISDSIFKLTSDLNLNPRVRSMLAEEMRFIHERTEKYIVNDDVPDAEHEFKWKMTTESKFSRFLYLGNIGTAVKHSSQFALPSDMTEIDAILNGLVADDKGLKVINTIGLSGSDHSEAPVLHESAIYILAVYTCCDKLEVRSKAFEMMYKFCKKSKDFLLFVRTREQYFKKMKGTTGWSRSYRNAVQKWYRNQRPLKLMKVITKCPKFSGWSHRDIVRLCHIVPESEGLKVIVSYLIHGIKKTLETYRSDGTPSNTEEVKEILRYFELFEVMRTCQNPATAVPIIKELELVWEQIPSQLHNKPQVWRKLIKEFPLGVLLTNLCRISKLGVLNEGSSGRKQFLAKLKDDKSLNEVHPYSILMYRENYRNALQESARTVPWKVQEEIVDALSTALKLSLETQTESIEKKFFITIDASKSMKSHILGNNHMQCRLAAACLTLSLARSASKVVVKAFSPELRDVKIEKSTSIEDLVKLLDETELGGTDCSRPLIHAKNKKILTDVFLVITDKETWKGKTPPYDALLQYRKARNPVAKLIVLFLNPNKQPTPVANPEDRGMLDIFGFNPETPDIISTFVAAGF